MVDAAERACLIGCERVGRMSAECSISGVEVLAEEARKDLSYIARCDPAPAVLDLYPEVVRHL